jgi:hypothetical protein
VSQRGCFSKSRLEALGLPSPIPIQLTMSFGAVKSALCRTVPKDSSTKNGCGPLRIMRTRSGTCECQDDAKICIGVNMYHGGLGVRFVVMLITWYLFVIPLALVNANIAKRKGRSRTFYGWMSIIPFVGAFMSLFLISLTDKAVVDKIDRLLEAVERKA